MFKSLLGLLWSALPGAVRRAGVRALEARFTVTVAAVVVDPDGRILILEHAFRPGSAWGIPGGFVGAAEQPDEALRRELREEVGLELEEVALAFARTVPKGGQVQLVYRASARGEAHPRTVEIKEALWVAPDALRVRLGPSQVRTIERVLGAVAGAPVERPAGGGRAGGSR